MTGPVRNLVALVVAVAVAVALVTVAIDVRPVGASPAVAPAPEVTPPRPEPEPAPQALKVEVLATRPHDRDAFTEGLVFADRSRLYESTGLYGDSELREVELATGRVLRRASLPGKDFGEGLAFSDPRHLVQLTYRENRAWSWATRSFRREKAFTYAGEGWGLARWNARRRLVMSDGSDRLVLLDPRDYRVRGTVRVRNGAAAATGLNELEVVGNTAYANVFPTDSIDRIDLRTGRVTGVVDASELHRAANVPFRDVLNGIAHRPGDPADVLWLTGKNWPVMFQVRVGAP
ncbi:MAG: glutaminyl-peptide cyclotransferase [Acidimicrobiia bacterium]